MKAKNQHNQEDTPSTLTPCGKPRLVRHYKSGKTFTLAFCPDPHCYPCRTTKLLGRKAKATVITSLMQNFRLVTVRIGSTAVVSKIPKFEASLSSAAKRSGIEFTFVAGYELQDGLVHIHYGLCLMNEERIVDFHNIVMKYAAKHFPEQAGDKQVEVSEPRPFSDVYDYVSKRTWSDIANFVLPKCYKRVQVRWRRGYRQFLIKKTTLPKLTTDTLI